MLEAAEKSSSSYPLYARRQVNIIVIGFPTVGSRRTLQVGEGHPKLGELAAVAKEIRGLLARR